MTPHPHSPDAAAGTLRSARSDRVLDKQPALGRQSAPGRPPTLGPLLAQLRVARGWSQLRMAEQLCTASGLATVSRHEISRWERQQRIPADFWLGWLATVLDVPLGDLTAAARAARTDTRPSTGGTGQGNAALRRLLALAHTWLADPTGPCPPGWAATDRWRPDGDPEAPDPVGIDAQLAELRRMDDIVGGVDLLGPATERLRWMTRPLPAGPGRDTRGRLALVAQAGQLLGWLAADAGEVAAALEAYHAALTAAAAARDRPLGAHVLGSASHLLVTTGHLRDALLLAHTGYAGARRTAGAGTRALLLHRIAFAAAVAGQPRAAHHALATAERTAQRRNAHRDPPWLYWLDEAELVAMTGRCLAAAGRPLRAEPLLARAVDLAGSGRARTIYGVWLARSYLDLGEVEQACRVADTALLDAARAGSMRAAEELRAVQCRFGAHRDEPAARRHRTLMDAARGYLPTGRVGSTAGGLID